MTTEVIAISIPNIDMGKFLTLSKQALGYDVSRTADGSTQKLADGAKFLSALSCFHNSSQSKRLVRDIIRDSASLCAHLSFTLAFIADRDVIFKSMERSGLKHTVADTPIGLQVAIVSGTLQEWKIATLECCTTDVDFGIRLLFDKVVLLFEHLGFREIWHDTKKNMCSDRTFHLERRSQ